MLFPFLFSSEEQTLPKSGEGTILCNTGAFRDSGAGAGAGAGLGNF